MPILPCGLPVANVLCPGLEPGAVVTGPALVAVDLVNRYLTLEH